jgi:hypothetical protein
MIKSETIKMNGRRKLSYSKLDPQSWQNLAPLWIAFPQKGQKDLAAGCTGGDGCFTIGFGVATGGRMGVAVPFAAGSDAGLATSHELQVMHL